MCFLSGCRLVYYFYLVVNEYNKNETEIVHHVNNLNVKICLYKNYNLNIFETLIFLLIVYCFTPCKSITTSLNVKKNENVNSHCCQLI